MTIHGVYQKVGCEWLKGSVTATIVDKNGTVVYGKTVFTNTTNGTWNLSSAIAVLPPGTYRLDVKDEANGEFIHGSNLYIQP